MRWYADDSDIRGIKTITVPNIILFGGIIVDIDNERGLRTSVESVKAKYGHKRAPVKWNFKDLKPVYRSQNKLALWEKFMHNMHLFREDLFSTLRNHDFSIIVSVIQGYSSKKDKLNELKDDLTRHAFSNALMRFGLHAQEYSPKRAEVVIDWPDKNKSRPFDIEYALAYNDGLSVDKIPYKCGALEKHSFNDSVVYTRMLHSTLLQLSDIIIGASREFVEHCLDGSKCGHGVQFLTQVCDKFRGYPKNVIGRGIFVNSQARDCIGKITERFNELYIDS